MSGRVTEGQARVAPVASAVAALLRGEDIAVDALLPAWRALSPAHHRLAGADVVDVAALTGVLARRPGVLAGDDGLARVDVHDDDPRGGRAAAAVARALADALVLRLESRKLAFGMTAPAPALRAAFADPATARDVLATVRDVVGVTVAKPMSTATLGALAAALTPAIGSAGGGGRPVHVVVGTHARRLLDLLSPYCRRLRVDLALAGRAPGGVPDDDDVYRGLARLLASAPATVAERRDADADEGFVDVDEGFVIDTARLVEDHVDRRVRGLVPALKRARAVVVGVVDERALESLAALDFAPASTRALVPASGAHAAHAAHAALAALVDGASGAVLPLADVDDGAASLSLPWRALAPAAPAFVVDEGGFAAGQALWRRRVDDARWPVPGVLVHDDATQAALQALAATVPAAPRR